MQSSPIWLFDLDKTHHHADATIFYLTKRATTTYPMDKLAISHDEANHLRQDYWHRYGATLAGLQKHHPEINILDFLRASHPMPPILAKLVPEQHVAPTLHALAGQKIVFSNAPSFYVHALIEAMQLTPYFTALLGTDNLGLHYKPAPAAYLNLCQQHQLSAHQCIMVDDSAANLHTAKQLGMTTIWYGAHAHELPFIDAVAPNMPALLHWANTKGYTQSQ